ncbi:MAG TPA: hypothetical protein VFH43_14195 [Candidatus Kapabacteria bacterium]|nr:hypothetical protein [Candidatus Kapabacteria bacterium]
MLFAIQVTSLYVTPVHNSYLWWGDESWLMAEYKEQLSSGVFRHPQAFGSSLFIANPFPFSAMWLTTLLYGGVSALFGANPIDTGRSLTAVLSVVLLLATYLSLRKLGVERLIAACGVALLLSTRTFLLTSHSARYDIVTALAIVGLLFLIARLTRQSDIRSYALIGLLCGASLLVSIHVLLLVPLAVLYAAISIRAGLRNALAIAFASALVVGALYLIHISTQPTLSGESNLSENLRTIPILRPFSWSVQSSNLEQKFDLLISLAPQFFLLIALVIVGIWSAKDKRGIVLYCVPFLGWLLLEPAGPSSYLIYFLPSVVIAAMLALKSAEGVASRDLLLCLTTLLAIGLGMKDAIIAKQVGEQLSAANKSAISEAKQIIGDSPVVALNPALSHFDAAATAHFIELPDRRANTVDGRGYLLTYNSSRMPGFMWEVAPLRQEIVDPAMVRTGHFLDVGRSYFRSLDTDLDTIFLQSIDLNALYTRHIR